MTLRQVSDLLGLTRTAVEKRRDTDLPIIAGSKPAQISTADALAAFERELSDVRARLSRLIATHEAFFPGRRLPESELADQADSSTQLVDGRRDDDGQRLERELAVERTGRAVAEARIESLKTDLRRANRAIDALQPDPDLSPDIPQEH